MNSRIARILKTILVIMAVLNLIFLFGFDYKIPAVIHLPFNLGDIQLTGDSQEEELEEEETAAPEETSEEPVEEVADELAEEPSEEETSEEEPVVRCIITATGESNIRSGPGTNYEVVKAFPIDTILIVTGDPVEGWLPIRTEDGTEGFIYQDLVRIMDDSENPESTENADNTSETGEETNE